MTTTQAQARVMRDPPATSTSRGKNCLPHSSRDVQFQGVLVRAWQWHLFRKLPLPSERRLPGMPAPALY